MEMFFGNLMVWAEENYFLATAYSTIFPLAFLLASCIMLIILGAKLNIDTGNIIKWWLKIFDWVFGVAIVIWNIAVLVSVQQKDGGSVFYATACIVLAMFIGAVFLWVISYAMDYEPHSTGVAAAVFGVFLFMFHWAPFFFWAALVITIMCLVSLYFYYYPASYPQKATNR
jgi:hypothetical protein